MVSLTKRMRRHNLPSEASQQYITLGNIDLARRCRCAGCPDEIFMDLNDKVVLGCYAKHTICMKYFTKEVTSAGCDNKLACPCCKEKKRKFNYHQQTFWYKRGEGISSKKIALRRTIKAPDKGRDPVRYFKDNVDGNMCEEFCSFTMATANSVIKKRGRKKKEKKHAIIKTQTGIFSTKDPDGWSENNIDAMESIFETFHPISITNDKNSNIQCDPFALLTSASIDEAINSDTSVLHRLLFALGYDQIMSETVENHDGKSWDVLIQKSFCITNLICFLRST